MENIPPVFASDILYCMLCGEIMLPAVSRQSSTGSPDALIQQTTLLAADIKSVDARAMGYIQQPLLIR